MTIVPIITTLAEYQTRFWALVGEDLRARGFAPHFVSFDDRSCDMLNSRGFAVTAANDVARPPASELEAVLDRAGVTNLAYWTSHERFAFVRSDDEAMRAKLARSIVAAQSAIADAQRNGQPVMVQEVGGFLSVIGSWFAARSAGIRHFFIEPSFFRGRLLFREGDFAAPVIPADARADHGADFSAYLQKTLADGQIVIPKKDAHHYNAAWKKVLNLRNARRFAEKAYDKYILGKRQEFGFIGQHAATHVKALVNSRKLAGHYTPLDDIDDFLYFPLHVPGDIALTLRSPEYLDQLALVDYICRHLPDGVRLAIKEHPAMVGMMQPDRLKAMLRRYPRLALIDPGTNNYAVMRRAKGVVTINSKTGAEAGLIGLPVIVLGDAFYREAPFAHALDNLVDLPAAMQKLVDGEASCSAGPARLDWFAGAWELSRPGELYVTGADEVRTFTDTLTSYLRA
ncbi:hypothetical protein [Sphingopyxis alaskensis]|jgi:hypothetical protein|uniref:Capsule polysaccharide biosynthesis n=1 Tax=Sphingopyxis alaskensis (strain DSM 13593 / LMG 18877 / RB2256) TaxID=317655 RepID=Q1GSU0_SPHAL|nr:hypothetical protein [Sphingopyxis alaskensis]ABF53282.1 conserved hypothetical protein [Sphingopyxis alaskensis RB2256]MCM3418702.1 hypothetical protein [Sphingopyxis alaskensis]